MSIITFELETPHSTLKVTKVVGVLTIEHFWASFHNDDVLQAKGMGLGWVCEFSFKLGEPHVTIFKGGKRWASGISQQTPQTTITRSD